MTEKESFEPKRGPARALRKRLGLGGELALALLPTLVVLGTLLFVEQLARQRLLFASLASSAFLIYLDPEHGTNTTRVLALSHLLAAALGWGLVRLLGAGYAAAGGAMLLTIVAMILLDAMHPPAVSTSLSFAFRAGTASDLFLFGVAVLMTVALVVMQRWATWLLARAAARSEHGRRDAEG